MLGGTYARARTRALAKVHARAHLRTYERVSALTQALRTSPLKLVPTPSRPNAHSYALWYVLRTCASTHVRSLARTHSHERTHSHTRTQARTRSHERT
eukprot:6202675-Pleurochrysis_carterae.AAC.5